MHAIEHDSIKTSILSPCEHRVRSMCSNLVLAFFYINDSLCSLPESCFTLLAEVHLNDTVVISNSSSSSEVFML